VSKACVEKRAAVNMLGPMPRRDKQRAAVNILGPQSTLLGCSSSVGGYPEGRVVGFEGQVLTARSRYWRASQVLACLSGVVNPELQFEFEEKDKKTKKHREIKGLKQKNKI
jgi:hypothetical protein